MKNLILIVVVLFAGLDVFSQDGIHARYIPIDSVDQSLLNQKVKIDFISSVGPKKNLIEKAGIADTVVISFGSRNIKVMERKGAGVNHGNFNHEAIELIDYEPGLIATSSEIELLNFRSDSILFRMQIKVYRKIRKKITYVHDRVEETWILKKKIGGLMVEKSARSEIANLIGKLFQSSSSKFIFNLEDIPTAMTDVILRMRDSLDVETRLFNIRSNIPFIAETYGKWNATDFVANEKLPSRRFIYATNAGTKWVMTYQHGGAASHFHIVYMDMLAPNKLSAGLTLLNMTEIRHLVFEGKQNEIAMLKLNLILRANEFRLFEGRVVRDDDVF